MVYLDFLKEEDEHCPFSKGYACEVFGHDKGEEEVGDVPEREHHPDILCLREGRALTLVEVSQEVLREGTVIVYGQHLV